MFAAIRHTVLKHRPAAAVAAGPRLIGQSKQIGLLNEPSDVTFVNAMMVIQPLGHLQRKLRQLLGKPIPTQHTDVRVEVELMLR
jgi:hypothetical protein